MQAQRDDSEMTLLPMGGKEDKLDSMHDDSTNSSMGNSIKEVVSSPKIQGNEIFKLEYLYIILNLGSAVGIVMANKWVFSKEGFNFGTILTCIHFFVTYLGLVGCAYFNVFTPKKINVKSVLPICISFCGFVVLTNLSLVYNSIGFYQIAKVGTMPTVMIIQIFFYKMHFSAAVKRSVYIICLGVVLASVTDVQVNLLGCLIAGAAVVVSALYQIWIGTSQKDLQVDSMQLLYYQAPISGLLLIPMIPFLDDVPKFLEFEWNSSAFYSIMVSAILAFFVNLSTFLIIGRFSAM